MIENVIRHFQDLWRAERLIADLHLRYLLTRSSIKALSALVAVFGLAMCNLTGFFLLEPRIGNVWAAASVGLMDFVLSALPMLASRLWPAPREMKLAVNMQDSAIEGLVAHARQMQDTLAAVSGEITAIKTSLSNIARHPIDEALNHLIVPLASIVARSFERKRRAKAK